MSSDAQGRLRVLFITRKHPPAVGGMENLSYHLICQMKGRVDATVIAWGYSQKYLPLFLAIALFRSLYHLAAGEIDLVHVGDALLSPLGYFLKKVSGKPVAVNLHGLDMTYPSRIYQWTIRRFLPRLDLYVCISRHSRDIACAMGIAPGRTRIIPCGVQVDGGNRFEDREALRRSLQRKIRRDIDGMKIAVTVGRLVRRKGVGDFVASVLPRVLERFPNLLYLVVGEGEEEGRIRRRIAESGLDDHVILLGRVDDDELEAIYAVSDLFIMPNVPVDDDVEGFGIVAIEASLAGLPVVASSIEGIRDAVRDGKNGILVDPSDRERFAEVLVGLLEDDQARRELGERGRRFTAEEFNWDRIASLYHDFFLSFAMSHVHRFQVEHRMGPE